MATSKDEISKGEEKMKEEDTAPETNASSTNVTKTDEAGNTTNCTSDAKKNTNLKDPTDTPQYTEGIRLVFVLVGLMLSIFCLGLDRSILATAIPKITTEFHSLDDVAWYGSAYLLTTASFQLLFGKMYAELHAKGVFLAALGFFELGSIVCAAAPNSTALIIGRALAGLGCAGVLSGALVILARSLPLHRRPLYTGCLSGATGIAQVLAPTLGGVLTDRAGWRWCFWINLPLGAVTYAVVIFLVRLPPKPAPKNPAAAAAAAATPVPTTRMEKIKVLLSKMDLLGTALLVPSIICLILALQWGGSVYGWNNWRIILCLCLFGVLILAWGYVQYIKGDKATLPFKLAGQRSVASGCLFSFGFGATQSLMIYYIPIWFQAVKNTDAEKSGVNFLASSASMVFAVIMTGILTSKIGYYVPQMLCCTTIISIATGLIYRYNVDTSTAYWAGTLVMFGFGSGMGQQMPLTAVQTVLQGPAMALGTATIVLFQTISGAIFLAVGENVFRGRLLRGLARDAPQVDAGLILEHGASGLKDVVLAKYGKEAARAVLGAYNEAVRGCFLICIILACLTLFGGLGMEWKSVKDKKAEQQKAMQAQRQKLAEEGKVGSK